MKVVGDKAVLKEAQRALIFIDESLTSPHGLGGIDTVEIGMRAMATTLPSLFDFPETVRDEIDTVDKALAYMALDGDVDKDAARQAAALLYGIHRASYQGLGDDDLESLEEARQVLYGHLEALITRAKDEISRG
jgi:hypothetical protein